MSYIFNTGIGLICLAAMGLSACGGNSRPQDHSVARQLFLKTVRLNEAYIDSIRCAPDSASLEKILEHYDNQITLLNYEFPPDTDLKLNEEENDSLIKMAKRMLRVRRKREEFFREKTRNHIDSVNTDSLLTTTQASR